MKPQGYLADASPPWPHAYANLRLLCGEEEIDLAPPLHGSGIGGGASAADAERESALRRGLLKGPVGAPLTVVVTPAAIVAVSGLLRAALQRRPRSATAAATAPDLPSACGDITRAEGGGALDDDTRKSGSVRWSEAVRAWARPAPPPGDASQGAPPHSPHPAAHRASPLSGRAHKAPAGPAAGSPLGALLAQPAANGCTLHLDVALKRSIEVRRESCCIFMAVSRSIFTFHFFAQLRGWEHGRSAIGVSHVLHAGTCLAAVLHVDHESEDSASGVDDPIKTGHLTLLRLEQPIAPSPVRHVQERRPSDAPHPPLPRPPRSSFSDPAAHVVTHSAVTLMAPPPPPPDVRGHTAVLRAIVTHTTKLRAVAGGMGLGKPSGPSLRQPSQDQSRAILPAEVPAPPSVKVIIALSGTSGSFGTMQVRAI